jgi:hypothetical protein
MSISRTCGNEAKNLWAAYRMLDVTIGGKLQSRPDFRNARFNLIFHVWTPGARAIPEKGEMATSSKAKRKNAAGATLFSVERRVSVKASRYIACNHPSHVICVENIRDRLIFDTDAVPTTSDPTMGIDNVHPTQHCATQWASCRFEHCDHSFKARAHAAMRVITKYFRVFPPTKAPKVPNHIRGDQSFIGVSLIRFLSGEMRFLLGAIYSRQFNVLDAELFERRNDSRDILLIVAMDIDADRYRHSILRLQQVRQNHGGAIALRT